MKLREYQVETLNAVDRFERQGITRQLIVLPTGGGKTVIYSDAIKTRNKKTIVLAHRDTLLQQAKNKIEMVWEAADVGICKAERNELDHQVVAVSIQTAYQPKRLAELKAQRFEVCIVDEAHRAASPSYLRVLEELGFLEDPTDKLLLGFTATPDRMDGKGLNEIFQKETTKVSIMTLIRAGYLCDLRGISVTTDTDISQVPTKGGEFVEYELAKAVNTPERNRLVVESYQKHCIDRKALVFCTNIQHVKEMHAAFSDAGIEAGAVYSKMQKEDIDHTLERYAAGDLKVLLNCAMLTEGYDDPPTSAILMARPTQSRILYSQAVGRGTRLFMNKKDCLVIDFCDNRHDICALPSMFGWKRESMNDGESFLESENRQLGEKRRLVEKRKAKQIELLDRSQFKWLQTHTLWILPVKRDVFIRIMPHDQLFMVELVNHQNSEILNIKPITFEYAQGVAEDYARANAPFARKDARWRRDSISGPQRQLLRKMGVEVEGIDRLTKGEASDLIDVYKVKRALL